MEDGDGISRGSQATGAWVSPAPVTPRTGERDIFVPLADMRFGEGHFFLFQILNVSLQLALTLT